MITVKRVQNILNNMFYIRYTYCLKLFSMKCKKPRAIVWLY